MIAFLLAAVLCPHPHRSQAPLREFAKAHACPAKCRVYVKEDGKFKLWRKCGRCQIDHVCALACGGRDSPENMQWLTSEENRAKSASCALCKGPLRCE